MITHRSMFSLLPEKPNYPLCFMGGFVALFVSYGLFYECCPPVNVPFDRAPGYYVDTPVTFEAIDPTGAALPPRVYGVEDEVIEEGSGELSATPVIERGLAEDVAWRWDEREATRRSFGKRVMPENVALMHDVEGDTYLLERHVPRGAHAAGLRITTDEMLFANVEEEVFYAREVDQAHAQLGLDFAQVFLAHEGVAYVAYYPEQGGIGVEIYAVDIASRSPLWRTTVRPIDGQSAARTEVQIEVEGDRLHVFTKEGELRRVDSLDLRSGEIRALRSVPRAHTELAPRESLVTQSYGSYVFEEGERDRQGAHLIEAAPTAPGTSPLIARRVDGETVWRLILAGDSFLFFPTERLDTEGKPDRDIVLSYDSHHSGGVITSLSHTSGEVLWTKALQGGVRDGSRVEREEVAVDVVRLGQTQALLVMSEDDKGRFMEYRDAQSGALLSLLTF